MRTERAVSPLKHIRIILAAVGVFGSLLLVDSAFAQQGPVTVTLDQAIQMALQHNHTLQAARTALQQNQEAQIVADSLQNSTEGDMGLSYLIERGNKRARRLDAAKSATAVTRSQVTDSERGLTFQVGSLFINVQLAQSTLELAQMDLKSFQETVDISEIRFKDGAMSENDYLKIKLQLLQFETDVRQALLNKTQALSDLRQQLGYESVPATYEVVGEFEYKPLVVTLDELQAKALQNRPDLRAAVLGVTAANSQYALAK